MKTTGHCSAAPFMRAIPTLYINTLMNIRDQKILKALSQVNRMVSTYAGAQFFVAVGLAACSNQATLGIIKRRSCQ